MEWNRPEEGGFEDGHSQSMVQGVPLTLGKRFGHLWARAEGRGVQTFCIESHI